MSMKKQTRVILIIAVLTMVLIFGLLMFRPAPVVTVGADAPAIQTNRTMDNVENVGVVRRVADNIENKHPSQEQISEVSLTVSGMVYGKYRSGSQIPLQGALVRVSGITGKTVYSGGNGEYSVAVTAYSDGTRVFLEVQCSKDGFHTANAVMWVKLGGEWTIPGLQVVGKSVTVNFVLHEETGMVYSRISGRVVDSTGNPVKEAVVSVYPNFELSYTFTDADGYFTFNYAVCFGMTEQAPTEASVTVRVYKQGYIMTGTAETVRLGDSANIPTVNVGTIALKAV